MSLSNEGGVVDVVLRESQVKEQLGHTYCQSQQCPFFMSYILSVSMQVWSEGHLFQFKDFILSF